MLQLHNIHKVYRSGDMSVHALKGINLNFRKNEFVSILGPSGCGKTTMLNLIGGLDRYSKGDLVISGRSTKEFKSSDWDIYRNHRVGFIFQSYNLIPHQNVLNNVALALTIAGIGKQERIKRAKEALDKVGLFDQYYKKPNQLSGGQCQRVAIARALVNDPEILLADEPTGALDSKTSVQIMDLVKEIAKERLVIMVTHNPELAEKYSTRIIKLHDGLLIEDTNPYSPEEEEQESRTAIKVGNVFPKERKKTQVNIDGSANVGRERAKMSFFTAFRLSLNNLFTKKARTIVMSVASAIGIIGVSLVLAISFGVQNFIADMQNDMLASNPIQINQTGFDLDAINNLMSPTDTASLIVGDWVNVEAMIEELYSMIDAMDDIFVQNRIDRNYIQFLRDMPLEYFSAMFFDYGLNTAYSIFTDFGEIGQYTSMAGIMAMYGGVLENIEGFADFAQLLSMIGNPIRQAPDFLGDTASNYLLSQFDVVYSKAGHDGIARGKNEVMIVLGRDNVLTDIMLGQIGFYSQDEFINIVYGVVDDRYLVDDDGNYIDENGNRLPGGQNPIPNPRDRFNPNLRELGRVEFSELMSQSFVWQPNNNIFDDNSDFVNLFSLIQGISPSECENIPFQYNPIMDSNWTGGVELTVVGILAPREDVSFVMLPSGVYYTTALAEYSIYRNWDSSLIRYMRDNFLEALVGGATIQDTDAGFPIPPGITPILVLPELGNEKVIPFSFNFSYREGNYTRTGFVGGSSGGLFGLLFGGGGGAGAMNGAAITSIGVRAFGGGVYATITRDQYNNEIIDWEINLDVNGNAFPLPLRIEIYSSSFSQVDSVTRYLRRWNNRNQFNQHQYITIELSDGTILAPHDRERVQYTDMLSLIMSMVSLLIDIITIALVSFTALSLVVSSVMIGILTYVSVMERIKEIGVIRSLGGRKRDVSNLFTAETFILGLTAGVIGIVITYIISLFINLIVGFFVGVSSIAALPWWVALIMIAISIFLTVVAGALPSRSAAHKDPVVALRSE